MTSSVKDHFVYDMETSDPDDFLGLLYLLGRTDIKLKAITITPGSTMQVGLVRKALSLFNKTHIPIGAFRITHPKKCVSPWHELAFGKITPSGEAENGPDLLRQVCNEDTTLMTAGPLRNLGSAIRNCSDTLRAKKWVAQGGFAGANIVPTDRQLHKFKGLEHCQSYNFNGDVASTLLALNYSGIPKKKFVSKNVCHGIVYDWYIHELVEPLASKSYTFQLIWNGMNVYLRRHKGGKKLHDLFMILCALHPDIASWTPVHVVREKDGWASVYKEDSTSCITTGYDRIAFIETLSDTTHLR